MRGNDCQLEPSDQQWKKLFDLSRDFRDVAPWQYQTQRPLFGVKLPNRNETVYICTVGFDSHRPGMIAYYGSKGFYCCQEEKPDQWHDPMELIFKAPHLKVVYMDRDQLRKEERKLIKQQGLKFRNRFNWPAFRSFMPGYVTWRLNSQEASDLIIIMEQTCAILKEQPDLIATKNSERILVRHPVKPRGQGTEVTWKTRQMDIPEVPECCGGAKLSRGVIRGLRDLPLTDKRMALDMFVSNDMLYDDQERPYYPMCLVLTDDESGLSIHSALLGGSTDMDDIVKEVGRAFVDGLRRNRARPGTLQIQSWTLAQILGTSLDLLDIKLSTTVTESLVAHESMEAALERN